MLLEWKYFFAAETIFVPDVQEAEPRTCVGVNERIFLKRLAVLQEARYLYVCVLQCLNQKFHSLSDGQNKKH